MSTDETYNGWTNRETWAVALHINNDQGLLSQVLEMVGEVSSATDEPYGDSDTANFRSPAAWAGDLLRENFENLLDPDEYEASFGERQPADLATMSHEVGSLWRVNWTELGESFLRDLEEQ